METYEPLKPPEYRRNELGQFDRPGKMLAKAQKKSGLTSTLKNNSSKNQSREPDGRFKNGGTRPGAGRPKGSPNKISQSLKEMILASLDELGGKEYLKTLAIENSSAYSSLIGKVLPTTLAAPIPTAARCKLLSVESSSTLGAGRRSRARRRRRCQLPTLAIRFPVRVIRQRISTI
jgi:hypothetical protein